MESEDEDQKVVGEEIKKALSKSIAWNPDGALHLKAESWVPLDVAVQSAPEDPGLYALGILEGLRYDKACTRIVYIGSAKNLRKRFLQHRSRPVNYVMDILRQNFPQSICATWWAIPAVDRSFLLGIEGEALDVFETVFGLLPICNLDVPEFSGGQNYCEGLVKVFPCDVENPIGLEDLANRLNRTCLRKGLGESIHIGDFDDGVRSYSEPDYKVVSFVSEEELRLERERAKRRQEDRTLLQGIDSEEVARCFELSTIEDEHIAAWSIDKMRELISLCNRLEAKNSRTKTRKSFEAPFRDIPLPHTWGEIALVQARITFGSWQAARFAKVGVLYKDELLGEARLSKGSCVGYDIADEPQRKTERPRCLDFEVRWHSVPPVEVKRIVYGIEVRTRLINLASEKEAHEKYLAEMRLVKEDLWKAVEDTFQRAFLA